MPFRLPTRVTIRPGCRDEAVDSVRRARPRHALVVLDRGLERVEAARLDTALESSGLRVSVFDGIESNPRDGIVDRLADRSRDDGVDLVVGIGGGSVLDAAKAVAMLIRNPGGCARYEGKNRFEHVPVPFVALPTTCGTGSEVTWVSVLSLETERRKVSIKGDAMFPADAWVDADLLRTLPAGLVASTGMDTLTHAVEAYVGRAANPVSDVLAEAAVRLVLRYLPRATADIENDDEAREAMAQASTIAGIAFGNADVAGVHCLSESIGGMFDVPHGLANAVLLVPVLRYQLGAAGGRLARLAAAAGADGSGGGAMIDAIDRLVHAVAIPGFAALGIDAAEFPAIAAQAERNNSNGSNPMPMSAADYVRVLEETAR